MSPDVCRYRSDQCSSCRFDAVSCLAVLGERIGIDRVCVLCQGFSADGFKSFSQGVDSLWFLSRSPIISVCRAEKMFRLFSSFTRGITMGVCNL